MTGASLAVANLLCVQAGRHLAALMAALARMWSGAFGLLGAGNMAAHKVAGVLQLMAASVQVSRCGAGSGVPRRHGVIAVCMLGLVPVASSTRASGRPVYSATRCSGTACDVVVLFAFALAQLLSKQRPSKGL